MNNCIAFLSVFLLGFIGYGILKVLRVFPKQAEGMSIGYGFGLGAGLVYLQLISYSQLGIVWSRESILFPWVLFFVGLFFFFRKTFAIARLKLFPLSFGEKLLVSGIVLSILYVGFEALLRPLSVWDGWATWFFKAKVFFIDGRVLPESLVYVGPDYPLMINLIGTYIYTMIGRIDDTAVLLYALGFYLSLSVLFYTLLQKEFGRTYALLGVFLWVTIQNVIRHAGRMEVGLADLPLGYFMFASTMLLIEYSRKENKKIMALVCFFLGITALIKVEGMFFSFLIFVLVCIQIYRKKAFLHGGFLLLWILPILQWNGYKWIFGLSYNEAHNLMWPENTIMFMTGVVFRILQELWTVKTWNMVWIIYMFTIIFYAKFFSKRLILIQGVIFFQFSIYLFMYFFMSGFGPESSIERLLIHLAPLAFYTIMIVFHKECIKKRIS